MYGRDAGVDLIESVIGPIKEEAIRAAEGKCTSIKLRPGKTGKAALAGMVETLHAMTGLKVTEGYGAITTTKRPSRVGSMNSPP